MAPLRDLGALVRAWSLLRCIRPAIVHAHTPKAGLIATLAAWMAGVPVRIYHVHGLPFVTSAGLRRAILRATESVASRFATQVLCVSHSVRAVAVAERLCPAHKIAVVGGGSINGVDAARFRPAKEAERRAARHVRGLPEDAPVVGYVGRIVRDKGWVELAHAWYALREKYPALRLLVVGPFEPQDPVPPKVADLIRDDPRIHHVGMEWDTPPLYAAMDLVVLPSYREGFPVVPLEAAAMALPVVATRIPGSVDAVEDGVTGTLVPPRDPEALRTAIAAYLADPELGRRHGAAARQRALASFSQELLWREAARLYGQLLAKCTRRQQGWRLAVKSLLDRGTAAAGLILLSPVLLLTAAAIRVGLGSPVLFRQERPGRLGKPFRLVKFRTMTSGRGKDGALLPDAERLTPLGRLLRTTSVDELPQLWNVLCGDLSLVGPRPLLMRYLPRYTPEQARRHDVLPGLTGWAQVNGRNALSWEEKFILDVWYVDNWALRLDGKILLMTLACVLGRTGVSSRGDATMPEFLGSVGPRGSEKAQCEEG